MNSSIGAYQTGTSSKSGGSTSIVLVRVFYSWHMMTPMLGAYLSNMSGNDRLLSYALAFRNEPF